MLGELERRSELVRSGVLTAGEDAIADHAASKIEDHFGEYLTHLRVKGVSARHLADAQRISRILFDDCGIHLLRDIEAGTVESWLMRKLDEGMGARTRNIHLQTLRGYSQWAVKTHRLSTDPLRDLVKAD